jgi:hypothetical protein
MSARARQSITIQVPPVELQVLDAKVAIVEVARSVRFDGEVHYHVSCTVEWGGYRSPIFHLDVKDNDELERKLKVEIAKMKLMIASGFTVPFQRIV